MTSQFMIFMFWKRIVWMLIFAFVPTSEMSAIELKLLQHIRGACEVDPEMCTYLNDVNTAEENIVIPSYEQVKDILFFDILSPTSLTQVPEFIFKKFPKLEMLRMMNTGIKALNVDNFPVGNGLDELVLRRNNITLIQSGVFKNLTALRHIDLAHNQINKIEPGAFNHLLALKTLFLSNNELRTIETNSLTGAANLIELDLESNKIHYISADALSFPKMEILSLAHNQLTSLSSDSFRWMPALEKLDLSDNDLKEIGSLFDECSNIYSLKLSNKPHLQNVNIFELTDRLPNLSFLHLMNSNFELPIEQQGENANEPNYSLTHLDISTNGLSDPMILKHLKHFKSLKTVVLCRNNFTFIDQLATVKTLFPRIDSIDLSQNPNIDVKTYENHFEKLTR